MATKFKMCPYCLKTKKDPLSRNYIRPDEDFCPSCKLEMLTHFLRLMDYHPEEIFEMYVRGRKKIHQ